MGCRRKLTASWLGGGIGSGAVIARGWLGGNSLAVGDALLVGQVAGSLAVTLGACGLAVTDGVHGVGELLALGAAVVVVVRA